jgi:hypothetical protein
MNIQRVDDAVFLAYIAKYVTKPEPHGFMSDTSELRRGIAARRGAASSMMKCSSRVRRIAPRRRMKRENAKEN